MDNSKKLHLRKLLIFFGGVIFQVIIMLVLPQLLSAVFSVDVVETLILLGILILMGTVAWFGISFFLYIINKEKDSLTDNDVQQVYNEENIAKHERCLKYVDVCSISRALNRPGLQIDLDPSEKEQYRLITPKEIKEELMLAKEIVVLSEQFSSLNNVDDVMIQAIIKEINRGLVCHELYVVNSNHETELEQTKVQILSQIDSKYKNNIDFVKYESASSILGNAFTSFVKVMLISKEKDNDGFYSEGYLMFYSILGEENVYYKLPHCPLHKIADYLLKQHGNK